MKPIYIEKFVEDNDNFIFDHLLNDLVWLEATSARKEYFMADRKISYTYGSGNSSRTYESSPITDPVQYIFDSLNSDPLNENFKRQYNVCFLNRYDDSSNFLGWHADDSDSMNMDHDICSLSFGAEREIWWKKKDFKGVIPKEGRQMLKHGSLFIMPAGFQKDHFHKIPKCDHLCGVRISLTFRNYV